jgi:Zn finger protein HypA/HybF involved in hydrogenase expression
MHEVSLVHALFDEVDGHVAAHPGSRVRRVRVRIGDAAGVEPELFRTAFDGTRDERGHGAADLVITTEAEAWACGGCGAAVPTGGPLVCPACGAPARLVRGDALFLDHLELEVPG